ncbi:phosphoenolpyruvate synthase [Candidatus Parcubacteria bacterium]|nr:phosphoenolpyruvate synthase [Candidatus Parcubacteria bacterium]
MKKNILWFSEVCSKDVPLVGGKNASLGEMYSELIRKGINIPNGFILTADAYWYFLKANKIDAKLKEIFKKFKPGDIKNLQKTGLAARKLVLGAKFPADMEKDIRENYRRMSKEYKQKNVDVSVRSSATAEDLPDASFAGQHETYLNVFGEKNLLQTVKKCIASLFTDRAISYREGKGFKHMEVALSVGVQKMIRSDLSSSGIMFTLDTETGFREAVLINSIWGIGEMIVQGRITPDEFFVFKPTLKQGYKSIFLKNLGRKNKKYIYDKNSGIKEVAVKPKDQLRFSLEDKDILTLAKWGCQIEKHYGRPQDIEWAKDGQTGQLFIVQARPETIHALNIKSYEEYKIKTKNKPILTGIAIGEKIGQGKVRVIPDVAKIADFKPGEILVTKITDPDWVPIMRQAAAIITNEGGKTCHSAIVARELGIPCIVGTKNATSILKTGQIVTADCTQGLYGRVYQDKIPFEVKKYDLKKIPKLKTKIMINIAAPEIAFKTSFLPNDGVGLAREEFIIAEKIRIHPLALYHYDKLLDFGPRIKVGPIIKEIKEITIEHQNKRDYFVKELAEGVAQIAAAFYPKKVIVRLSDFKTNEYKNLIGGELFEKEEANPMMGFRGACRYLDKGYQPAFKMECQAIKRVREIFGLINVAVMIPFCRTVAEGKQVLHLMKEFGLTKGENGLEVVVMCEIPANVILADEFLDIFDGMSIGSNDLTQLSLGLDRDNANIAYIGDERNEAVKKMIAEVIKVCKRRKKYIGICGEAPSTYKEFAKFLADQGIESMSLNPATVIKTILNLAE